MLQVFCFDGLSVASASAQADAGELVIDRALVLPRKGAPLRVLVSADPVAGRLVMGSWTTPAVGEKWPVADGSEQAWEDVPAREGAITHGALRDGYALWQVDSPEDRVALLDASSHSGVFVNGVPRAGDPYSTGAFVFPVELKKGKNELLFSCGRGRVAAKLVAPKAPLLLHLRDCTLPDAVEGEKLNSSGAAVVVNASTQSHKGSVLRIEVAGSKAAEVELPELPPCSTRKVSFPVAAPAQEKAGALSVKLSLHRAAGSAAMDQGEVSLRVVGRRAARKITFVSKIDGSLQYFGLVPPLEDEDLLRPPTPEGALHRRPSNGRYPLVLTLHGASVEGIGQAEAYAPKRDALIVAPTNRRPFGFDWEDWGRLDALEVLDLVIDRYNVDPQRVMVTGHSMGGHGTWSLGSLFPDRFAAVAPSAGWISFLTYAGGRAVEGEDGVSKILRRAASASDTMGFAPNLLSRPVYVLHGDADDNVPVTQARTMREWLGKMHADFSYYERKGAGHWWGNECVDWKPMFEMFERAKLPTDEERTTVDFVTPDPGMSAECGWLRIEQQERIREISEAHFQVDRAAKSFKGTTSNVAALVLRAAGFPKEESPAVSIEIDGQKLVGIRPSAFGQVFLVRREGRWSIGAIDHQRERHSRCTGPFKEAFRNGVVLIYGTKGNAEENAWSYARARFDAETFWVRGNGSVQMASDVSYIAKEDHFSANVILYGNQDTNSAFERFGVDKAVDLRRGALHVGGVQRQGEDLAVLCVRRRDASGSLIGIVGGTGLVGMRLTGRVPYFVSGLHLPDLLVLTPEVLTKGPAGIAAAGFFGNDWSVKRGEVAWR